MSQRDPLEAERARVAQLERELDDARLQVRELEKVRAATEPEKAPEYGRIGKFFVNVAVYTLAPFLLLHAVVWELLKLIHSRWFLALPAYALAACVVAYLLVGR